MAINKIYETETDLHIRGTYVYVKANADGYAYADSTCTEKIDAETLINMFNMGTAIIVDGSINYKAVSLKVTGTTTKVATLTYVKANTTTATTAVLATVNSKEYSA